MSLSVRTVTLNGSFRSGVTARHRRPARSATPERSLPWMTAARTAGSGALRKRSTSGRFDRLIAARSRLVRQGLDQVDPDLARQFGGGALLTILLRGDGGVGLVGGGVGGGHGPGPGERRAAVQRGQGP